MTTQDPLAALLHDAMMSDEGKTMEGVAAYLRAHGVTLAATPPAIDPERLARALLAVNDSGDALDPCAYYGPEVAGPESRKHARAIIAALDNRPYIDMLDPAPPAIDPERLARALADWFSTALLDQDFRGYRRWSALANEAAAAIIAAYEADGQS